MLATPAVPLLWYCSCSAACAEKAHKNVAHAVDLYDKPPGGALGADKR